MQDRYGYSNKSWVRWGFFIGLFVAVTFLIIAEKVAAPEIDKNDYFLIVQDDITRVYPDGHTENLGPVTRTTQFKNEAYVPFVVQLTIPDDFPLGTYYCLRASMQSMKIYVDGELRNVFDNSETRPWGNSQVSGYVFVPIDQSDAGKTLSIETVSSEMYSGTTNEIYMGTYFGICKYILGKYGIELILEIAMLMLALVFIITCIVLAVKSRIHLSLAYIALSMMISSLYLLVDSVIRQLYMPNISLMTDFSLFFALIVWVPHMLYLDGVQKGRHQKKYNFAAGAMITVMVCMMILVPNGAFDAITGIVVGLPLYLCAPSLIVYTLIADIRKGYFKEYKIVGIIYIILFPLQLMQVFSSFVPLPFSPTIFYCIFIIALLIVDLIEEISQLMEARALAREAAYANEAKSNFLANMSHEIRTPINSIMGMGEMILRESNEPEIVGYANIIQSSGKFLLGIINDILDFSKIEAGKMEIVPDEYKSVEMISDLVEILKERAEKKNLKVNLSVSPDIPSVIVGDVVRVKQIILNIISNSVKYTEHGSVTFTADWHSKEDTQGIRITVSDTGIGMKDEEIDKLFDKFARLDTKRNAKTEGTGLGMSIVKYLVSAMDGTLDVSSKYGVGTEITVFIPQKVVDATAMGDFISESRTVHSEKKEYKPLLLAPQASILVVDDVRVNRTVFKALLKQTQIHVDMAGSGKECLEKCENTKYDLIYMDHLMPEMDGIDTFKAIRAGETVNKDTPVIVLTANAISGAKESYEQCGFDEYLSKPVEAMALESSLIRFLPPEKITSFH